MGRNGQNRRGHDLGTNAGSNTSAGTGGAGSVRVAGLTGAAGVSSARSGGDDGDIVDGGNGAGVRDGKGGGRRWLPSKSILPLFSLFLHLGKVGYNS